MKLISIVLSEGEARRAREAIGQIEKTLTSQSIFDSTKVGLPVEVLDRHRSALSARIEDLRDSLNRYESAKAGDAASLEEAAAGDLGAALVVARIARGFSQKELGRRLGLKEQQIQRYETERYKSISLQNYKRVANALSVSWRVKYSSSKTSWVSDNFDIAKGDLASKNFRKILRHARENSWFEVAKDEDAGDYLRRYVADHIALYGTPGFLRTGFNKLEEGDDLLLIAWKARVTRLAEKVITQHCIEYCGLEISWVAELVRLSVYEDGPRQARDYLLSQGIVLIVESQIEGLRVDGAAFMVGSVPVVGLTLRRDTIDGFWFTLVHEIAHVVLHSHLGLKAGFFDDCHTSSRDEIEAEADFFALNVLIPDEIWRKSPARISKTPLPIEKLAKDLKIHSAIIYGRIQRERNNYAIFADKIGRGNVRRTLTEGERNDEPG